jgi:hypothetical protein
MQEKRLSVRPILAGFRMIINIIYKNRCTEGASIIARDSHIEDVGIGICRNIPYCGSVFPRHPVILARICKQIASQDMIKAHHPGTITKSWYQVYPDQMPN